ncbi:hypothetical protein HAX54_002268, partial [Datura stramonium]|nr:hypothetical protein [Datura stramonium]
KLYKNDLDKDKEEGWSTAAKIDNRGKQIVHPMTMKIPLLDPVEFPELNIANMRGSCGYLIIVVSCHTPNTWRQY